MKFLAIAILYVAGLIIGIGYLVFTLGSVWFANTLTGVATWMLIGCVGSGILSGVGSYLQQRTDLIAGFIFSLPTSFFALGAIGSVREEPQAFIAWAVLSGALWSSAVAGGVIVHRSFPKRRGMGQEMIDG